MPGMTTTRSLLPDAVTAGWISRKRQRRKSLRLLRIQPRAARGLSLFTLPIGRYLKPRLRARRIDFFARRSELGWHTTRVLPGAPLRSADGRVRTFGTAPPAAGLTLVSGAGFGQ